MGTAVIDRLRMMVDLPATGTIAGQAVASALDDLYGQGGGVYNDVDVFRQMHSGAKFRAADKLLVPTVESQALGIAMRPRLGEDYSLMTADRQLVPTLVSYRTYTVAGTARKGLLNLVLYKASGALNGNPRMVLQGFDLNCVRVAVDIETKRLHWDWHFEQFMRTSEVRIVAGQTPLHSFLRLLKKRRELPNVTANVEASAALTWLLRRPPMQALQASREATFWFGDKYRQIAQDVQAELQPYFTLRSQWLQRNAKGKLIRGGAGDELSSGVLLNTLAARGTFSGAESVQPLHNESLNAHALPGRVYRSFERRASGIVIPALPWLDKAKSLEWSSPSEAVYGEGYYAGLTGLKDVAQLERELPLIPSDLSLGRSAREVLDHVAGLEAEIVRQKVSDPDHVKPAAARMAGATAKEAVEAVLARERAQQLSKFGVPLSVPSDVWRLHLEHDEARVTPLRNVREAQEFFHSVGWGQETKALVRLDGVLLGAWGGRDKRDAAVYQFKVDEATLLMDWTFRVHKRPRMPTALETAHVQAISALFQAFRAQGAVLPFRSKR